MTLGWKLFQEELDRLSRCELCRKPYDYPLPRTKCKRKIDGNEQGVVATTGHCLPCNDDDDVDDDDDETTTTTTTMKRKISGNTSTKKKKDARVIPTRGKHCPHSICHECILEHYVWSQEYEETHFYYHFRPPAPTTNYFFMTQTTNNRRFQRQQQQQQQQRGRKYVDCPECGMENSFCAKHPQIDVELQRILQMNHQSVSLLQQRKQSQQTQRNQKYKGTPTYPPNIFYFLPDTSDDARNNKNKNKNNNNRNYCTTTGKNDKSAPTTKFYPKNDDSQMMSSSSSSSSSRRKEFSSFCSSPSSKPILPVSVFPEMMQLLLQSVPYSTEQEDNVDDNEGEVDTKQKREDGADRVASSTSNPIVTQQDSSTPMTRGSSNSSDDRSNAPAGANSRSLILTSLALSTVQEMIHGLLQVHGF